MRQLFFSTIAVSVFVLAYAPPAPISSLTFADAQIMRPLPPIAFEMPAAELVPVAEAVQAGSAAPARLVIPSLDLDVPIQGVGVNAKGEIDVPSGKTNAVGWYKHGVQPGETGTAVLDAHVFAAFKQLQYVKPGADVYVITDTNQKLHFVVAKKQTFPLRSLSSKQLFTPIAGQSMNLITCAGSLTADHSTYDHRLIVYTKFVG